MRVRSWGLVMSFLVLSASACSDDDDSSVGSGGSGGSKAGSGGSGGHGGSAGHPSGGSMNVAGGAQAGAGAAQGGSASVEGGAAGTGGDVSTLGGAGQANGGDGGDGPEVFVPGADWPPTLTAAGVCSPDGWCWQRPQEGNALDAIWGASATDVWAVGRKSRGCGASIVHYDGNEWRGTACIKSADPSSLSGTSGSDVWATSGTEMLHYNGATWSRLDSGTEFELTAVHALSANAAWAVGKGGAMVKWNGASWQTFDSGTTDDLNAVWAFAANDIWRASASGVGHFTGTDWTEYADPACKRLWGDSSQNLYCYVGNQAWRWNGTKWSLLGYSSEPFQAMWGHLMVTAGSSYVTTDSALNHVDANTTPTGTMLGLWAPPTGTAIGVGERADGGPVWTFTANVWTRTKGSFDPNGDEAISYTATTSTGDVWLVGGANPQQVTRFNAPTLATWTSFDPVITQPLHSVAVGPGDDVWIGGEQGAVAHLESGTFKPLAVGSPFTVNAIWVDETGSPWAGGGAGKVRTRTGGAWVNHDLTATNIRAIWGRSSTDLYAGGSTANGGAVFHYTGTKWEDTQFAGLGDGDVMAIWGTGSRLFAYDGSVWELIAATWKLVGSHSLIAETALFTQGTTLWTTDYDYDVGATVMLRWNGATWDKFRLPDSDIYSPTALAALPSGEAWAFGPSGAIRHRAAP